MNYNKQSMLNQNSTKKIFLMGFALITIVAVINSVFLKPSPCKCLEYMYDNPAEYNKCVKKYYNEAFDYVEKNYPTKTFQNYDAVVQFYWMEKCKD